MATTATIPISSIPIGQALPNGSVQVNSEWARFFRDIQVRTGGAGGVALVPSGGTGYSLYSVGDMLYADTTTTFARLNAAAAGNVLLSGASPSWGKVGLTTHVSGTLGEGNGGTGFTAFASGVSAWLQAATSANLLAAMTDETGTGSLVFSIGPSFTAPLLGIPASGDLVNCTGYPTTSLSGTVDPSQGGTGITSYTVGDLLYASGATALSKLADVATGNALISGGVTTAPAWGKIGLTTHVSGILPVASGGTGNATGLAATATALATGRTFSLTGDATGTSAAFDGTAAASIPATLATVNASVGSFGSSTSIPTFTVNGKGLITAASGNAVVAPAGTLTGATLAAGVTASSLTSVGTLATLTVGALTTTGNTILGDAQADTLNVGSGDIIKDSSGRVGIGRTSAGEIFETNRALSVHGSLQVITGSRFSLDYSSNVSRLLAFGSATGTTGSFSFYQASSDNSVSRTAMDIDSSGQVILQTAGRGLSIKEGSNCKQGTATLVAGTVTVSNTSVTASSRIFISRSTAGGTLGHLSYTKSAGASFTVTSTSATETSSFDYEIFEPS